MLPPAENCCGSCSLLHGVQTISFYTVAVGTFSVLALLMNGSEDRRGESQLSVLVDCLATFVHTLALFAGLKGLIGVMLKDPRRLRVLLVYHVMELVVMDAKFGVKFLEACKDAARLMKVHKDLKFDCSQVRLALMIELCIHTLLFTYFIYIIWSLVVRLEDGQYGRPQLFGEHELADRDGLSDPWSPWLLSGNLAGDSTTANLLQQRPPNNPRVGGAVGAEGRSGGQPPPFSGAPRTLQEQNRAPEPFRGTAHRLE